MENSSRLSRRSLIARLVAGGALALGTRSAHAESLWASLLRRAEPLTRRAQRLFAGPLALAPEFAEADISADFRANGTVDPDDDAYRALAAKGFADWRLEIAGLVETPFSLSLGDLRAMPARTQITRHDCVEGWSDIAKWTGAPLAVLLDRAKPLDAAKYVLFRCADPMDASEDGADTRYYESIDLDAARHPQTILAYEMNGEPLTIAHGAPLRLRVERQLGYKMAKYLMRIELIADYAGIRGGGGGYWEDQGYEWYAGI